MHISLKLGTRESPLWSYSSADFTFSPVLHIGGVVGPNSQGIQIIVGPVLFIIAWGRKAQPTPVPATEVK